MELTLLPLYSGSSGNAVYVGSDKTGVLVDAGLSGRTIERALAMHAIAPAQLRGILITHEHSDHIKGAGILSRKYDLPVYANERTWVAMQDKLGVVSSKNQRVFDSDADFYIRDLGVTPFHLPHDAAEPVGYCFTCGGLRVGVATDLGHVSKATLDAIGGCEALLLESNHDVDMLMCSRYPYELKRRIRGKRGHLSNEDAGEALIELCKRSLKRVFLGHLSQENNMEHLAMATVSGILQSAGVEIGTQLELSMAHRDRSAAPMVVAR